MSDENLERRVTAVEAEVVEVRREAAAARALASGADRDVADYRAEMRAHTRGLEALRQTQIEHYAEHKTAFSKVDIRLGRVETRVGRVETGLAQVETRVGQVETGLGRVETGLERVETRLGQVETGLGQVETGLGQVGTRFDRFEAGLAGVEAGVQHLIRLIEQPRGDSGAPEAVN